MSRVAILKKNEPNAGSVVVMDYDIPRFVRAAVGQWPPAGQDGRGVRRHRVYGSLAAEPLQAAMSDNCRGERPADHVCSRSSAPQAARSCFIAASQRGSGVVPRPAYVTLRGIFVTSQLHDVSRHLNHRRSAPTVAAPTIITDRGNDMLEREIGDTEHVRPAASGRTQRISALIWLVRT